MNPVYAMLTDRIAAIDAALWWIAKAICEA
jgi:hypothetical protein